MHTTKIEITDTTPTAVKDWSAAEFSPLRLMTIDGVPVQQVEIKATKSVTAATKILVDGNRVLYRTQIWVNGDLVLEDMGLIAEKRAWK